MKRYKLYFENGKVLLLGADHVTYSHDEDLNTNMFILYDASNNVIGAFDMNKMLGHVTILSDLENTENTEKEIKCIGFQAPKEVAESEIKKKQTPKKKPTPKKKENNKGKSKRGE